MGEINEARKFELIVHGVKQTVDTKGLRPETTLNEYLRDHLHLTGTKYMCREGGCGVCIVSVTAKNPRTGVKETFAVNSCLVSILSCAGWDITTTEGLGNRAEGYHPIQQKIVQFNGTQCGFCTPGMVMNMHALQETGKMTMAEIENSFGGNICRCTGYRPLLSAFKSMASDADETILGIIPDIEEIKLCKKDGCKKTCPTPCEDVQTPAVFDLQHDLRSKRKLEDVHPIVPETKNWFKVGSISEIFTVFSKRGDEEYKLVAGNTGKGVYWDMAEAPYYIDISGVADLRMFSHNTDSLVLGGNFTITEMMNMFTEISKRDDGFQHLKKVVDHLDLVATVPVRNIGTIAGNLFMKYKHNEFPSDIFLLLETIKAKLILIDNTQKEHNVTLHQFLGQNMTKKIIARVEIPPLDGSYKFESYKIMPKSQNAHAHINAGFLFKLNGDNIVEEANICFGGINPTFVHARNGERYITGKKLFDNGNMQTLFQQLKGELMPDYDLPDPTPLFRQKLAIALTYKCILSLAPEEVVSKFHKSGGNKLVRPSVSTGTQDFKTNKSMYPIGQPVDKYEAADQTAGAAKYVMDQSDLPGQLYAAFVLAKAPAGSVVKSIDASKAMSLEDVSGFFQASDIEEMGGMNTFVQAHQFMYVEEEKIFVAINDKVQYYYQPVGVIVAKTQLLAEHAAEMVDVSYDLPTTSPFINARDVVSRKEKSRIINHETVVPKHQDLNTPRKLSGKLDMTWQYHYHMEDQCVSIEPDEDGRYNINGATQWLDGYQLAITGAFKVPAHKLNITARRCGGAYGAKITRSAWVACAAMLAALKLHKPIKFWLPFHVNMNVIGCRNPVSNDYEVGFDENGKIGFLNHTIYHDVGLHPNESPKEGIMDLLLSTYNPDTTQIDYNMVRTDMHTAVWTRSPGTVEGVALMENVMEHISCSLDKDPVDVRLANLNDENYPLIKTLFEQFVTWSDFRARRSDIESFNKENRWRKRGIALCPMVYKMAFWGSYNCHISIYNQDGTVCVSHGGVEIGQGINTKVVQTVAHCLGIDMSLISVYPSNNMVAPNSYPTGGSQTSEAVCFGFTKACKVLKQRIDDAAKTAKLPENATWPEKVKNAYNNLINLASNEIWSMESSPYPIYAIAATEVEVDILTGNIIIQRADLLEDVGDSMSPIIDMGQCEGAFVMGLGYWTSEEMIFDHDGQKMTNRTWTYKPPGCKDIPVDFRVKFPDGIPNPLSPFKTKATGEPPLCLAISVALAIRHAIKTARTQANPQADPWAPINGPCSVEWNFLNSLNEFKQYTL